MSDWIRAAAATGIGFVVALLIWWLTSGLNSAPDRRRLRRRLHTASPNPTTPSPGPSMGARLASVQAWGLARIASLLDHLRGLERLSRTHPSTAASGDAGAGATAPVPGYPGGLSGNGAADDALELRLARAGFAQPQAARRLLVLKSVLFLTLPVLTATAFYLLLPSANLQTLATGLTLSAALAHYGPDAALAWWAARRRERLQRQLPGFTDLLQVCVQAGMGLDAAVQRVVADYRHCAPELSQAFHQASLEMRAGVARQIALQRMARIGHTADLRNLVAMLVQAEQFGTSLADALKQQAEEIRARQMARAEERAARIPVLMLIPLVLCIFPALMTVLMGPAVIQMMQNWIH